ncbi:MAG: helix-turn-helix transcriptional regulator [Clostridia bacterium]|nr:helix-turn-helix transcriptional regulator [Clostridia bacterium]
MFYRNPTLSWRLLDVFYVERKGRSVRETDRRHCSIAYRVEGNSVFDTENGEISARSESVLFLPEKVDYVRRTEGEEKLYVVHLECRGGEAGRIEIRSRVPGMEPLFAALWRAWEEGGSGAYNRCMTMLYQIFERLEESEEAPYPAVPRVIEPGVKKMLRDYRDPHLTVAALAKECFVSEVYFRRVFRAHFGTSPLQEILEMHYDYARRLLQSGYHTPGEAAFLSGFSDAKHFRNAFKKRYGVSPAAWAKKKGLLPQEKEKPRP